MAVPTESHLDVALRFIEQGVHVLVEKPLARTVEEADRLVTAAATRGVILAVGHTERFNPAVAAARQRLRGPRFIEARSRTITSGDPSRRVDFRLTSRRTS